MRTKELGKTSRLLEKRENEENEDFMVEKDSLDFEINFCYLISKIEKYFIFSIFDLKKKNKYKTSMVNRTVWNVLEHSPSQRNDRIFFGEKVDLI